MPFNPARAKEGTGAIDVSSNDSVLLMAARAENGPWAMGSSDAAEGMRVHVVLAEDGSWANDRGVDTEVMVLNAPSAELGA
mmetsp:Transcript_98924/g.284144  ORF Transcript_98924/g.284144 Transcript_98924/m.284144 type:complete len:81 (+) Transcript_98924:309-551(+)